MRRAARVDANQAAIVDAMRKMGASVWILGLPLDLLVGAAAGVPFFFKQWGGRNADAGGCELDGAEVKQWPRAA